MAKKKNWIPYVPEYQFKKKFGKREITVTLESFLRALEHLRNIPEPDRAMAYMALYTGQRLGDLRLMTWDQVDETLVRYRSSKTQVDDLHIPDAPPELLAELEALKRHATTKYIFANPKSGQPYSANAVRRHIKMACDHAGLPHFTPHQIRNMATTTGLELSGDPDLVMKWIGWLNPEMIRTTYGHVGNRLGRLMDAMSTEVRQVKDKIRQSTAPSGNDDFGNVITFSALKKRRRTRA